MPARGSTFFLLPGTGLRWSPPLVNISRSREGGRRLPRASGRRSRERTHQPAFASLLPRVWLPVRVGIISACTAVCAPVFTLGVSLPGDPPAPPAEALLWKAWGRPARWPEPSGTVGRWPLSAVISNQTHFFPKPGKCVSGASPSCVLRSLIYQRVRVSMYLSLLPSRKP